MPPVSAARDVIGAAHRRADTGGAGRRRDRADPADHGGGVLGQLRLLAEERLARLHREAVRAEAVELGQEVGLPRRRDPEHRHERGDADGDAERGERRAQPTGAQPDRPGRRRRRAAEGGWP